MSKINTEKNEYDEIIITIIMTAQLVAWYKNHDTDESWTNFHLIFIQ